MQENETTVQVLQETVDAYTHRQTCWIDSNSAACVLDSLGNAPVLTHRSMNRMLEKKMALTRTKQLSWLVEIRREGRLEVRRISLLSHIFVFLAEGWMSLPPQILRVAVQNSHIPASFKVTSLDSHSIDLF